MNKTFLEICKESGLSDAQAREWNDSIDRRLIDVFGTTGRKTPAGEREDCLAQIEHDYPSLFGGKVKA